MRLLGALLLLLTCCVTVGAADYRRGYGSREEAAGSLAARPLDRLEGLWQLTPMESGMLAAIVREPDGSYAVIAVESHSRAILPGTVVGRCSQYGEAGVYKAGLYAAEPLAKGSLKSHEYTLKLDRESKRFTLTRKQSPLRLGVSLSVPLLLLRPRISTRQTASPAEHGAVRVYPPMPGVGGPVYF